MGVVLTCLTSCASFYQPTFYQVYTVEGSSCDQSKGRLVYQNDDCKISYNFWSEDGDVAFTFENTSGSDIFIDMRQSFFFCNQIANCYYSGRTYEYSSSVKQETYGLRAPMGVLATGSARAISVKEQEVLCVPKQSAIKLTRFSIRPTLVTSCNKEMIYPKDSMLVEMYQKENSPVVINNRISYSFDQDLKAKKQFDNVFWISNVENYSSSAVYKWKPYGAIDCDKEENTSYKVYAPNKFFKTYQ